MKNITRAFRETELLKAFRKLKRGIVLDVGAKNSPYLKYIPHKQYLTLDIVPKNNPDFVADLHRTKLPSNKFDTIIASEVFEHLYNPKKAANEIYRLLKPSGTCIISTPAFYPFHPDPFDYYRYTEHSLKYIFDKFKSVDIIPHGNRIHIIVQILTYSGFGVLKNITPLLLRYNRVDHNLPLGYVVVAKK